MHPLVRKIISALLFYGAVAAATAGLLWAFNHYIWEPQNFTYRFTDRQLAEWTAWVPNLDRIWRPEPVPVQYEFSDLRWLGLLCGLPVFVLFVRWSLTDLPILQHAFNVLVRCLLAITLVLSLCGLQRTDYESHVASIFIIDVSESVPDAVLEQAHEYVQSVRDELKPEDDLKVITFSKRPRMLRIGTDGRIPKFERHPEEEDDAALTTGQPTAAADAATSVAAGADADPPQPDAAADPDAPKRTAQDLRADGVNQHTNIQAAMRLAYGLFPPDHVKRIFLITDGNQTEGDLLGEAYNARTHGIKVFTRHFPSAPEPEVMIRSVMIKDRDALRVGKPFEIEVELFSTYDTEVSFEIWQGEFREDHHQKTVVANKGETFVTFTTEPYNPGPVTYRINMKPKGADHYAGNNIYRERLVIEGKPRVLYVEGNPRRAHFLQRALEGYTEEGGQNFVVEVRPPSGLPNSLEEILQFDCVILSDTPVSDQSGRANVTAQKMKVLDDYVRIHGGGFIAIGGEQAFGLGGYQDTPIEKMLPVRFEADLKREHPVLALALVIDKSGSMDGQKMELAKDAAKATAEVLGKNDKLMVIAFDDTPVKQVPMQRASNRMQIIDKISRIRVGGGTNIQPALEEAYLTLATTPAKIKHVILLTDGQSPYGSINELTRQMHAELITISTVAVGTDADTVLLNMIADNGGGRAYFTNDPYSVPRIFLQETSLVTQNSIIEEPFQPKVVKNHAMLKGLSMSSAPDLLGYVSTQKKDGAEVILTNPYQGDPLLATWRWGIGKTTVFTSDVKNRWATAWVSTRTFFPKFWAQVVRETMRRKDETFFEMRAELRSGRGHVVVDAIDENDDFINGLVSTVQVHHPDGKKTEVELFQTAPGLYEGDFELGAFGPYYLEAVHRKQPPAPDKKGEKVAESRTSLAYPYPTEYFYLEPNTRLVEKVTEITDGKVDPTIGELFDPEGQKVTTQEPLWMWFIWPAFFLIAIDVLFRRVRFYGRTRVPWHKVAGAR